MVGAMAMPAGFEYKDVFLKGYPRHERFDSFRAKHPSMDNGRRAKIFSPFDALKGFNEAVAAKEVLYEFKRELSEGEKEEVDRRLSVLRRMVYNSKAARKNLGPASIAYYVPCQDKNNFAYGCRGHYVTVCGVVWKIGLDSILVGETHVMFSDIIAIESSRTVYDERLGEERNIFDTGWEVDAP